jgi:hypothetical protein
MELNFWSGFFVGLITGIIVVLVDMLVFRKFYNKIKQARFRAKLKSEGFKLKIMEGLKKEARK